MSTHYKIALICATILFSLCTNALGQETITLNATKDNSMFEEGSELSNGAGRFLFAGTTADRNNGARRRALLAFEDLTGLGQNPSVTNAELTLFMSKTISGSLNVSLHRALADWGEAGSDARGPEGTGIEGENGDVTWTQAMIGGDLWSSPGGDYVAEASSTASVDVEGQFYTFPSTPELIADIELWAANPDQNYGWVLLGDESAGTGTAKRFNSREHDNTSRRPMLAMTYIAGEAPFAINYGHSGGWFNFDTAGQGIMIEVFPQSQQLFLTWFTYQTAEEAKVGSADHRWLSGLGTYENNRVEIDLQVTSGGFFDDPTDVDRTEPGSVGTVILEFSSCAEGTMSYDIEASASKFAVERKLENTFSIQRLSSPPQVCLDQAELAGR